MREGGVVPPHSVLAPGSALGLLPSRALSSAQVIVIVGAAAPRVVTGNQDKADLRKLDSARLFDRGCPDGAA